MLAQLTAIAHHAAREASAADAVCALLPPVIAWQLSLAKGLSPVTLEELGALPKEVHRRVLRRVAGTEPAAILVKGPLDVFAESSLLGLDPKHLAQTLLEYDHTSGMKGFTQLCVALWGHQPCMHGAVDLHTVPEYPGESGLWSDALCLVAACAGELALTKLVPLAQSAAETCDADALLRVARASAAIMRGGIFASPKHERLRLKAESAAAQRARRVGKEGALAEQEMLSVLHVATNLSDAEPTADDLRLLNAHLDLESMLAHEAQAWLRIGCWSSSTLAASEDPHIVPLKTLSALVVSTITSGARMLLDKSMFVRLFDAAYAVRSQIKIAWDFHGLGEGTAQFISVRQDLDTARASLRRMRDVVSTLAGRSALAKRLAFISEYWSTLTVQAALGLVCHESPPTDRELLAEVQSLSRSVSSCNII